MKPKTLIFYLNILLLFTSLSSASSSFAAEKPISAIIAQERLSADDQTYLLRWLRNRYPTPPLASLVCDYSIQNFSSVDLDNKKLASHHDENGDLLIRISSAQKEPKTIDIGPNHEGTSDSWHDSIIQLKIELHQDLKKGLSIGKIRFRSDILQLYALDKETFYHDLKQIGINRDLITFRKNQTYVWYYESRSIDEEPQVLYSYSLMKIDCEQVKQKIITDRDLKPDQWKLITTGMLKFFGLYSQPDVEVVPRPILSRDQIKTIFNPNRKVIFAVLWNQDTFIPSASVSGDENSAIFETLSEHKMFSLAFADLYELNREKIDEEASTLLKPGQRLRVWIYFQRFNNDYTLDYFGESNESGHHPSYDISEGGCFDSWKKGRIPTMCAPLVSINLELLDGTGTIEKSVTILDRIITFYGPGTGYTLITTRQVLDGIKALTAINP